MDRGKCYNWGCREGIRGVMRESGTRHGSIDVWKEGGCHKGLFKGCYEVFYQGSC